MNHFSAKTLVFGVLISGILAGCSAAGRSSEVRNLVHKQYRESAIQLENAGRQGRIMRQGTILTLNVDGVPANALRIIPATLHSAKPHIRVPARHVHNYAPVVIDADRVIVETQGEFMLPRGTQLAVLDHKIERGRVRFYTHTVDLVRKADGTMVHGCTEFIFPITEPSDATAVQRQIERALSPAA